MLLDQLDLDRACLRDGDREVDCPGLAAMERLRDGQVAVDQERPDAHRPVPAARRVGQVGDDPGHLEDAAACRDGVHL